MGHSIGGINTITMLSQKHIMRTEQNQQLPLASISVTQKQEKKHSMI